MIRKRHLRGIAMATAIVVSAVAIFFLLRQATEMDGGRKDGEKGQLTGENTGGDRASASSQQRGKASSPKTGADGKVVRGTGNAEALLVPGFMKLSPEVTKAVLEEKDNLPLTTAALLWSRDNALWERAREQMGTQPLMAATVAFSGRDPQERLDGALSLMAQQPENPLGYIAALNHYSSIGDTGKTNELLEKIPSAETMNTFSGEMRSGSRGLFDMAGCDPVEKGLLLSSDSWQQKIAEGISGLTRLSREDLTPDEKAARASLVLNLIDGSRNDGKTPLPQAALAQLSRTEELMYRRLPGDFRLPSGSTVQQEAERLSMERVQQIEQQKRISAVLKNLDYDAVGEYYRILDEEGDSKASKWLLGESPPQTGHSDKP